MLAGRPVSARALWQAENRIFTVWQHRRPTLLRDGALGGPVSTYIAAPVRLLFALKEPNDSGARWSSTGADLRLHAAAFAELRSTFPVLLLLAHLAQQAATDPSLSLPFTEAREQLRNPALRRRILESIALVNLKKTPGGPVCNDRSLVTAVDADGDLLLQQLALYRPHLTIAGGASVHTLLARLTRTTLHRPSHSPSHSQARPYFHEPGLGLCLSFYHPQATKGYEHLYTLLRENLLAHSFASLPASSR